MAQCYSCGCELTEENKSLEHIIPNVFGGKLKSKEILCKKCNNEMSQIDKNLCNNFDFFNTLANPQTDRPTKNQYKAKINDCEVIVSTNMNITTPFKPEITKNNDNKTQISFQGHFTPNSKEEKKFRELVFKTFNNIAKKENARQYSKEEIQTIINKNSSLIRPIIYNDNKKLEIPNIILGYLKILFGFCAYKKIFKDIDRNIIDLFVNKNTKEIENYVNFTTLHSNNGRLCHRIYLIGNPNSHTLLGYVSLYGVICMSIILNNKYLGDLFEEYYCYDIINHKEIKIMEKCDFISIYNNSKEENVFKQFIENIKEKIEEFMHFFVVKNEEVTQNITFALLEIVYLIILENDTIISWENFVIRVQEYFYELRKNNIFVFLNDEILENFLSLCKQEIYEKKYCIQHKNILQSLKGLTENLPLEFKKLEDYKIKYEMKVMREQLFKELVQKLKS